LVPSVALAAPIDWAAASAPRWIIPEFSCLPSGSEDAGLGRGVPKNAPDDAAGGGAVASLARSFRLARSAGPRREVGYLVAESILSLA